MNYSNNRQAVDAYARWLSYLQFHFFCTFTTRLVMTATAARKRADLIGSRIDAGAAASIFWCSEFFRERGGVHLHALIRSDYLNDQALFMWWSQKYGRCQVIDNRYRGESAAWYVSKYVGKQLADYDLILSKKDRRIVRSDVYPKIQEPQLSYL
jgi:hypothetical protein